MGTLLGALMATTGALNGSGAERSVPAELEEGQNVTVITSEKLTFDYGKNYAVFEENVVVTDPGMQLTADKLAVWFSEAGDITLIKAEGNVHITQDDKTATSGEATYDVVTGKILLLQNPRLQRGLHYLEGTTITYWRNQELLVVEPQSKLVIFPDADRSDMNLLGN
jgi:lipopolysaccharide transport protein LptA